MARTPAEAPSPQADAHPMVDVLEEEMSARHHVTLHFADDTVEHHSFEVGAKPEAAYTRLGRTLPKMRVPYLMGMVTIIANEVRVYSMTDTFNILGV